MSLIQYRDGVDNIVEEIIFAVMQMC